MAVQWHPMRHLVLGVLGGNSPPAAIEVNILPAQRNHFHAALCRHQTQLERRLIQGQVPAGRGVCVLRGQPVFRATPRRHAIHQRSEHVCVTAPRSVAPCAEQGSRRSIRRRSRSSASYAPARGRDWRAQARHVPRSHRGSRVRPCDQSTRQAILPTVKFLPNHARVAAPASLVTLRVLLHIQVGQCAQRLNLGALTVCGRVTAD
jgi:hypothetical protein